MKHALITGLLGWSLLLSCNTTRSEVETRPTDEKQLPRYVQVLLDTATEVTLYSLEPRPGEDNAFHGWNVLGQTTVKESAARKRLLSELRESIGEPWRGVKCFDPRHALSGTLDGKTIDLVICFHCGWVHVFVDGKKKDEIETDPIAQLALDEILRKAKVPLEPKRVR